MAGNAAKVRISERQQVVLGERHEWNYLPLGLSGRMRMSYLLMFSDRSSRLLSSFISFLGTITPIG